MTATRDSHEGLTFSRVLDLRVAPISDAAAQESLLQKVKDRALDPSVFDTHRPFFWPGQISSSRWDAYDTRMAPSTLRNYAAEAEAGVAFLRNHNSNEDPTGYTFQGVFTGAQGDGIARVDAMFYALEAPDTAGYIAKIKAGVVRDLSVGFYGGQWICSLCNRDMHQWMGPDSCPHLLGMSYPTLDADGKVQKDAPARIARATIEGAHLAEVSGVYDGATPGAMVGKARSLAAEGHLTQRLTAAVERRYHIYLPEPSQRWAGATLSGQASEACVTPASPVVTPPVADHDPIVEEVRAVLTEWGLDESVRSTALPGEVVRVLAAEIHRLRPLVDAGTAYRAELIAEALDEGVRASGDTFTREIYRGLLQTAPLESIKRMRDDFRRAAEIAQRAAYQQAARPKPRDGDNGPQIPPSAHRC